MNSCCAYDAHPAFTFDLCGLWLKENEISSALRVVQNRLQRST